MQMRMEFKEFRASLNEKEKHIWDMLNLGYNREEIINKLQITKWSYHRTWNRIVKKGRGYFK